jgi:hypothetical protein
LDERLHQILPKIIKPDQTGYAKKRFIGKNIRLIQAKLNHSEKYNVGGFIAFLDFKKAIECLDCNFMFEVLKKYNFGESF